MALVRAGEAGSDVYVYVTCACIGAEQTDPACGTGGVRCCGPLLPNVAAAINHLEQHQAEGHHVPGFVFDELRAGVEGAPYRPGDTFSWPFLGHLRG